MITNVKLSKLSFGEKVTIDETKLKENGMPTEKLEQLRESVDTFNKNTSTIEGTVDVYGWNGFDENLSITYSNPNWLNTPLSTGARLGDFRKNLRAAINEYLPPKVKEALGIKEDSY